MYKNKDYDEYFKKLVPDSGPARTVEGEMLRAISKICYRYYNDGDMFWKGYGVETAGSAFMYLKRVAPLLKLPKLVRALDGSIHVSGKRYRDCLVSIVTIIVKYIKSRKDYMPNTDDMLNYGYVAKMQFGDGEDAPEEEE